MAVPTPPDAPITRTLSPGLMPALRRKCREVDAPKGSEAASSNDRLAGFRASRPSSGIARYWAWHPIAPPGKPNTSSPTRNRVTSFPTDSIVPAISDPMIGWRGRVNPKARRAMVPSPVGTHIVRTRQSPEVTVVA
jgi:hypothetical protein